MKSVENESMTKFIKFPHTYHLLTTGAELMRGDKLLPEEKTSIFFDRPVIIEEKIDGANIGFSFNDDGELAIQNRGSYITPASHEQFKPLTSWVNKHYDVLFDILLDKYILFGEWCYAMHSIYYDLLPDWFLAFDIFDKRASRFVSRKRRHNMLNSIGIYEVPLLSEKIINKCGLELLMRSKSMYGNEMVEGLYLRIDDDVEGYNVARSKVVRKGFLQIIDEHWSKEFLRTNRLKKEF